jgi:hypothetical protein
VFEVFGNLFHHRDFGVGSLLIHLLFVHQSPIDAPTLREFAARATC